MGWKRWVAGVAALVLCAGVFGCRAVSEALRGYATARADAVLTPPPESARWSDAEWGAFYVLQGDFGTLTTDNLTSNALPWKLVLALADVVPEPFVGESPRWHSVAGEPLRRFGVVYGGRIAGPPSFVATPRASPELPIGYALGTARRSMPGITLQLASVNCSVCHLGRGWDADGNPTSELWWGIPNHSIDFDGLSAAVVKALRDPRASDEALLQAMQRRSPTADPAELETYRKYVLPAYRKGLEKALARWGGVHPWRFGGPGLSHGAAILRESLAPDRMALEPKEFLPAYTKIPNVFGVVQKERILIDASYVSTPTANADERFVHHLVGFLPVLGASVDRAIAEEPRLEKVRAFLATLEPPPFPGMVDAEKAAKGKVLFAGRCAKCHGSKEADGHYAYPNRRFAVSTIGTDPNRAEAVDEQSVARFNATAIGRFITVEHTGKYAPPPLWGVWANAPYFHNASVPTLWAVLKPEDRPARFWVGGHRLDLQRVGIGEYPPDYAPWSEPQEVDTSQPGRSNRGHEEQVSSYTDEERWQLIEYLKTL